MLKVEENSESVENDIRAMLHAGRVLASLKLLRQWRMTLTSADGLCPGEVLVQLAEEAPQSEKELDSALSHVWRDSRLRARFIARHGITVLGLLSGCFAGRDKAAALRP